MTDSKGYILIVDDDSALRRALSTRLEAAGYAVGSVASGEAALQVCEHDPPDAVILDVTLPGMDGYQVCERIRETVDRPVGVIFLTGTTHAGTSGCLPQLVRQSGGDYFVAKPYDCGVLLGLLRRGLAAPSLENEEALV
ncbi:MAG: Transcriptional regulatory protein AfsQ1 [Phycisphaerae bacterium]|nr:Transcriptional regulatory protein AfsQ1 [Phycisphaerae bacterium]